LQVQTVYQVTVAEFQADNLGDRADYDPVNGILAINLLYCTYLDLLHENVHLEQIKRAFEIGINITQLKVRYRDLLFAWFEQGAYEFERSLHIQRIQQGKSGFSEEYLTYLDEVLYHPQYGHWNKGVQNAASASPTLTVLMERLWHGRDWEGLNES
jgi:hypothetical protein